MPAGMAERSSARGNGATGAAALSPAAAKRYPVAVPGPMQRRDAFRADNPRREY